MNRVVRRRDLKAKPEPSDEALLKSAKAAATRASNKAAKLKRAAEADHDALRAEP